MANTGTLCTVSGDVETPGTLSASGSKVEFRLNRWDVETGQIIVPETQTAVVASDGTVSIDLWRSVNGSRGSTGSWYQVTRVSPDGLTRQSIGQIETPDAASADLNALLVAFAEAEPVTPTLVQRAEDAAEAAEQSETNAAASEDRAQEWAENPEDDPVVPGSFSALHHAAKAKDAAASVQTQNILPRYKQFDDRDSDYIWAQGGPDGTPVVGIGRDGTWHTPTPLAFDDIEREYEAAIATQEGVVLASVPRDGVAPVSYMQGGDLRIAASGDQHVAEIGDLTILNHVALSHDRLQAAIQRPATSVVALMQGRAGHNLLVPVAPKKLHVIIGMGQSNMVGSQSADSMESTSAPWPEDTLMLDTGADSTVRIGMYNTGTFVPVDPADIVGFIPHVAVASATSHMGETPMEAFAHQLSRWSRDLDIQTRICCINVAKGGTAYSGLKKGTDPYGAFTDALTKIVSLAAGLGWTVEVSGVVVKHGESDQGNTGYYDDMIEWQGDVTADAQAITGQTSDVPFFHSQPSSISGSFSYAMQAMVDLHASSEPQWVIGPDYPFAAYYEPTDYLHFDGDGYFRIGEMFARAWRGILWSGRGHEVVRCTGASRAGTTVSLTYSVPFPPLVFDDVEGASGALTERGTKGFTFHDDGGEITISSATITDDGTGTGVGVVELELASTPSGTGERVDYAYEGQTWPRTEEGIARGNLRDSMDEKSRLDGIELHNWAVHQRVQI